MTILEKRTYFSLLVFDEILINSYDSNYWKVNAPDQEIKISVSLSSVIMVNITLKGLFSPERAINLIGSGSERPSQITVIYAVQQIVQSIIFPLAPRPRPLIRPRPPKVALPPTLWLRPRPRRGRFLLVKKLFWFRPRARR